MITLHHLEYSQSFRVLWLLEELGIEYTLKRYDRDSETLLAPEDYKALSPLGTAPVLEDDALVLAETAQFSTICWMRIRATRCVPSPATPIATDTFSGRTPPRVRSCR